MNAYIEEKTIPISSELAWQALTEMNMWLPKLSTNESLQYDTTAPFFEEKKNYFVKTKEGIVMKSQLFKIDEESRKVEIHAHWFVLHSVLFCEVSPISEKRCKIIRTQSYPNLVGTVFTSLFNKRESGETSEYLDVWENYAMNMLG